MNKYAFLLNAVLISPLLTSNNYPLAMEDESLGKALFRLAFYIFIVVFVIIVAVYGTRFLAKSTKKFINSKYIKIIDSLNVGVNLKIVIVQINNFIYILAITSNNIQLIDKIAEDQFQKDISFEEHLEAYTDIYFRSDKFFDRIQWGILKKLSGLSKDIDEEESCNEKDD